MGGIFNQRGASFREVAHEVNKQIDEFVKNMKQEEDALNVEGNGEAEVQSSASEETESTAQAPDSPVADEGHQDRSVSKEFLGHRTRQRAKQFPEQFAAIRSPGEMAEFLRHNQEERQSMKRRRTHPEYSDIANCVPDSPLPVEVPADLSRMAWSTNDGIKKSTVYENVCLIERIRSLRDKILEPDRPADTLTPQTEREPLFIANESPEEGSSDTGTEDTLGRHRQVTRAVVALMLSQAGFVSASSRALDVLTDVTTSFVKRIGRSLANGRDVGVRENGHASILDSANVMDLIVQTSGYRGHFADLATYRDRELPRLRSALEHAHLRVQARFTKLDLAKNSRTLISNKDTNGVEEQSPANRSGDPSSDVQKAVAVEKECGLGDVTRLFGHFDEETAFDVLGDGCLVPFSLANAVARKHGLKVSELHGR
eukprot:Plantae.Rhodophyta-Rhodochaete_pulchella.ctg1106.p1 GENE.Plantae.Rhodophyta-Rhodochaete_pulchella.ctg1106~~Plantae.Rhodophyta-Rhodochaete_pulchella.ctg1106.p1  ORF type:complete len:493 (+),score=66.18 Plantae.Rhodophyta-Rhodochaete_pulchella.ctg1106:198-1481(+)